MRTRIPSPIYMANVPGRSLRGVRPGDYVAVFYDELADARKAVEPYAIEGLHRGDYVVLVVSADQVEAWAPLSQRLDEMVRSGEVSGQFAALFYPPSTAAETRRLLSDFLEELPRSFKGAAERHVRIVGDLPEPATEPLTCALRLSCAECSSLCLFHADTMARVQSGPFERVSGGHSRTITLVPRAGPRTRRPGRP